MMNTIYILTVAIFVVTLVTIISIKIYKFILKTDKLYKYFIKPEKSLNSNKRIPPINGECPTEKELDGEIYNKES